MLLLRRIAIALLLLGAVPPAFAGRTPPAPTTEQQARKLYQEGEAAFTAGRFVDAVKSFQAAYELSHASKLLWNIAQSWRRQHDVSGDVADLRRARAVLQNYRELASNDGERLEATTALEQVESGIEADEAKARAAAAPPPAPVLPAATATAPAVDAPARARVLKTTGLAVGAAGLVVAAVGGVIEFLGQRAFQQIDSPSKGYVFDPDTESRSQVFRPVGWTLVGVGVAAIAGGATAFALGVRADKPAVSLLPALAPGHAGLVLSGAF